MGNDYMYIRIYKHATYYLLLHILSFSTLSFRIENMVLALYLKAGGCVPRVAVS